MLHALLSDIGEHRIGATKGDHRHLGEEDRDVGEDVALPKHRQQSNDRHEPQRQKYPGDLQRPTDGWPRVSRHPFAERRIGIGDLLAADLAMSVA